MAFERVKPITNNAINISGGELDLVDVLNTITNPVTIDTIQNPVVVSDITNPITVDSITNPITVDSITNNVTVDTVGAITNPITVANITNPINVTNLANITNPINVDTVGTITNDVRVSTVDIIDVVDNINTLDTITETVDVLIEGYPEVNQYNYNNTVAGTRVQMIDMTCSEITIQANRTNVGTVYIGNSSVSNTVYGCELGANDRITLKVNNVNLIWIDVSNNGDGVSIIIT